MLSLSRFVVCRGQFQELLECANTASVRKQIVRGRKYRGLPKGKTKIFKVNLSPELDPFHRTQYEHLYALYYARREMFKDSFAKYIEIQQKDKERNDQEALRLADAQHRYKMEFNDEWNQRVGEKREARQKREFVKAKRQYNRAQAEHNRKMKFAKEKTEELMLENQKYKYVTAANLDKAVEEAVEMEVKSYDFPVGSNAEPIPLKEFLKEEENPQTNVKDEADYLMKELDIELQKIGQNIKNR